MSEPEPEYWDPAGLCEHICDVDRKMHDRRFAFILGAGASVQSGIPAAGELVRRWIGELQRRLSRNDQAVERWATAKALGIPGFSFAQAPSFYAQVFARRFRQQPDEGYADLEDIMLGKDPSFGYSVLAHVLAETRHKLVITTNFDNLVGEALSIFTGTAPLVCGHESLANFIRLVPRRPVVVKIHRDLLMAPMNHADEIAALQSPWIEPLTRVFSTYTPIVLGYGGNDGSLMGFLRSLPVGAIHGGIFWCYYGPAGPPSSEIRSLVAQHRGALVPIEGFDELMLRLSAQLRIPLLDHVIESKARDRVANYRRRVEELQARIFPPKRTASEDDEEEADEPPAASPAPVPSAISQPPGFGDEPSPGRSADPISPVLSTRPSPEATRAAGEPDALPEARSPSEPGSPPLVSYDISAPSSSEPTDGSLTPVFSTRSLETTSPAETVPGHAPELSGSRTHDVTPGLRRRRGHTSTRSPLRDGPRIFAPPLADASTDTLCAHISTDSPAPAAGPKSDEPAVDPDTCNMSEMAEISPAPPPGSQTPYRDADEPLQRALQQVAADAREVDPWSVMMRVRAETDRQRADQLLRAGLTQFPNNEDLLFALAELLSETPTSGSVFEAIFTLNSILRASPDNPRALLHLALLYAWRHAPAQATEALRHACKHIRSASGGEWPRPPGHGRQIPVRTLGAIAYIAALLARLEDRDDLRALAILKAIRPVGSPGPEGLVTALLTRLDPANQGLYRQLYTALARCDLSPVVDRFPRFAAIPPADLDTLLLDDLS